MSDDVLTNVIFVLIAIAMGLGYIFIIASMYRKARASQTLTSNEGLIVGVQIAAFSLWIAGAFALTIYSTVSPLRDRIYQLPTVRLGGMVANWLLLGFIGVSSLISGVSMIYLWFRKDPLRGHASRLAGLALLIFLIVATRATLSK
jgi:uncharacterized protein YacL